MYPSLCRSSTRDTVFDTFPWPQEPTKKQMRAVRAAYGMGKNDDIPTHLLALNHACAEKEKAGQTITPPGLPLPPEEHAAFITTDCIEAPQL